MNKLLLKMEYIKALNHLLFRLQTLKVTTKNKLRNGVSLTNKELGYLEALKDVENHIIKLQEKR